MENKKKKTLAIVLSIFAIITVLGTTFAFITQTLAGNKQVVINAGVLDLVLEEENAITISDAMPMYDEVGMIQEDVFEFSLVNKTSNPTNYVLKLENVTPLTMETDQTCSELGEITINSPEECRTIVYPTELRSQALAVCQVLAQQNGGTVSNESECVIGANDLGIPAKTFEDVIDYGIGEGYLEDTRELVETYPDNYVTIDFPRLDEDNIKYYLTKEGTGEPKLLSSLPTDGTVDSGTIGGNDTIDYTLRLWIKSTVTDQNEISGKSLSYKLNVESRQKIVHIPATSAEKIVDEAVVGENCKTYDDGVDTFLVGQCSNNYVWYSGKLWRVVLKNNETGAVKMVTDNAITEIPYNESGNMTFENSYMDQWLNQEFLPTLHDYEDYLVVDSVWDATENSIDTPETSSDIPSRPSYTTAVTRTVGLLNIYEYYTTYNNSDGLASVSTGYLKNGVNWWLMTPYSLSNVHYVSSNGYLNIDDPTYGFGARPSVNLKSTVQISEGSGIKSDPYILEGDIHEPINGTTLLNTRYSGEYITFNNELYRIVDIENGLTKITAVYKPSVLTSNKFNSDSGIGTSNFANASIKTDLETYYQGLKTTNESAYNMIEPNTTWYLGMVEVGDSYKVSICATVDTNTSMNACIDKTTSTIASIGLPRVGEMFTSQITRATKVDFWTLTPVGLDAVFYVTSDDMLAYVPPTYGFGARPSMYLKSGVKIASNNTGNGTYEHPYSVE